MLKGWKRSMARKFMLNQKKTKTEKSKEEYEKEKVWRKLFGWKVGDTCAVQLKTKKVYGKIVKLTHSHNIQDSKKIPCAVVEYETKSPISHRQVWRLSQLLEDDRNRS